MDLNPDSETEVHVCHKCGLVRWTIPAGKTSEVGLKYCKCMGRTVFDYENTPRTIKEALDIAYENYHGFVELYKSQDREQNQFERLKEEYGQNKKDC